MITPAEILASYEPPHKFCLMGNEAVARGAIEAGVRGVFAYPGTPSTEISETIRRASEAQRRAAAPDPIYFEFSVNEKVAVEKAIAYSLGGRSAMCVMKAAGMNVASDPLMTIPYQIIGQPLVLVVCDDPGCFSSTTEQDSRYWGKMASVPLFNPSTPQDAYEMTLEAFSLSARLKMPCILRTTTRVSHSRGVVGIGSITVIVQPPGFIKSPQHLNIPSRTAAAHRDLLAKLAGEDVGKSQQRTTKHLTVLRGNDGSEDGLGIIASGVAASYANELIARYRLQDTLELLIIGIIHPFPMQEVLDFLKCGFSKVLVLEELDPIVEDDLRLLVQKHNLKVEIFGKGFAGLSTVGEYSLDIVRTALTEFTGIEVERPSPLPLDDVKALVNSLTLRPPTMCPGCSHRATYYALRLAIQPERTNLVLCGDIGCFAMGAFAPFQMIDTIHHMGMSVSMAQGISEALRSGGAGQDKTIALVGDGTMFHSGIPSLLNAVHTRANIMIVVFDNRTIGMTGHQPHPGSESPLDALQVDLKSLALGMGVEFVEVIDPKDIAVSYRVFREAWERRGVSLVISQSPCVFLPEFKDKMDVMKRVVVDPNLCNTCGNQEDSAIVCSRCATPESNLNKARAKLTALKTIPALEQRCPANICNHGFFTALLNGAYGEAIQIVRDKTLFVRVCGDICPRPCEYLYREKGAPVVPIRKLKRFVAGRDDFFLNVQLVRKPEPNGLNVAIVGAGPAGLSAAYDLVRAGYNVVIFEKEQVPGGLLRSVIPDFRIDKTGYESEIAILDQWGVRFEYGVELGRDMTLEELSIGFSTVVLAIGMGESQALPVIEEQVPPERRSDAISFLKKFNSGASPIQRGASVLVIGGGNSAIDSARAAIRDGASEVFIAYRRSRADMPAFDEEIEEALSEGVKIIYNTVISAVTQSSERLSVEFSSFSDGRPSGIHRYDYVITAVGQKGREEAFASAKLPLSAEKRIIADEATGRTSLRNVFVAGDVCAGNHVSLIGAIAGGKRAANGIRAMLEGYPFAYEGRKALEALNANPRTGFRGDDGVDFATFDDFSRLISEYYITQPCRQCNHCIENFGCPALLMVNGKVVIDDSQCTRCGLCIDVCINDAIHWAAPDEASFKREVILSADS